MNDPFNLARFVEAQERVYSKVLDELRRGRKTGHWIWYVFPQIAGLGLSQTSRRYSITSIDEARAYAEHPILGQRLIECIEQVMAVEGKSAEQIFGHLDALKFRSCLTLFAVADSDNEIYQRALETYFGGVADPLTVQALGQGDVVQADQGPFENSLASECMSTNEIMVFFYGLFMDESLLASKGVRPTESTIGYVDGYGLRIGKRATLLPEANSRAYGVLMKIASEDAAALYSEQSVADYVAEPVVVTLPGDIQQPAVCYNLPAAMLEGTNPEYAAALLALATKLGLPDGYLRHIRNAV